jgi:hypothetical protein
MKEVLTQEQIDLEKEEVRLHRINQELDKIRYFSNNFYTALCSERLNKKNHYLLIPFVKDEGMEGGELIPVDTRPIKGLRVYIECAFCGPLGRILVFATEEQIQEYINKGLYKHE